MNLLDNYFASPLIITSLILALLALGYSITTLLRRLAKASKFHRFGLIAIHILSFIAIVGLLFQPYYFVSATSSLKLFIQDKQEPSPQLGPNEYLLVDSIDALTPNYVIKYQDQIILEPEQLLERHPSLSELIVYGDGLSESQWESFKMQKVSFDRAPIQTGIISPSWQKTISNGNQISFSGTLQVADKDLYKVEFIDPAEQVVAEAKVRAGDFFTLVSTPKIDGLHLYRLRILNGDGQQVAEEIIPVIVEETSGAKILVVQSAPSFEVKQLQNWAAEYGATFLTKTKISKELYSTRSTNSQQPLDKLSKRSPINSETLEQFDMLIMDGREFLTLKLEQLKLLEEAINNGLGLLILTDQELIDTTSESIPKLLSAFSLNTLAKSTQADIQLVSENNSVVPISETVLLSALPLYVRGEKEEAFVTLIETPKQQVIVAKMRKQLGSVSVSILKETHRLVTSSQKQEYSRIWQHLISNIARVKNQHKIEISAIDNDWAVNQRMMICEKNDTTEENSLSKVSIFQALLPAEFRDNLQPAHIVSMQQNSNFPTNYCGYFWPTQAGWHTLSTLRNSEPHSNVFYVHNSDSWKANIQNNKIKATKIRAKQPSRVADIQEKKVQISDWLFWSLLIVCYSLIWIERKYWNV